MRQQSREAHTPRQPALFKRALQFALQLPVAHDDDPHVWMPLVQPLKQFR